MRIQIKGGDRNFSIRIPNWLLANPVSVSIAKGAVKKYAPEKANLLTLKNLSPLAAEIKRIKKRYGTWTLVEVQSADGEEITITI